MSIITAARVAVVHKAGKLLLMGKQYTPEVLTVVGAVAVVGAVVLAVKATLKVEEAANSYAEEIDSVKYLHDEAKISDREYTSQLTKLYVKRFVKVGKLYVPTAILLVGGVSCFVGSTGILRKRNIAAVAAYNVVKDQYDTYRRNVIETEGAEKDREYRLGLREETVLDENGKKVKVMKSDPSRYSRYARIFDEGNPSFNKNWREGNLTWLLGHQNWATERLQARGWLTLNEVYETLGLPQTPDGAVVGWSVVKGDDYVDFGIFDLESPAARDFVNGYEPAIVLDFNVAGFIQDYIGVR